jgi:acetyl esterase/lipase
MTPRATLLAALLAIGAAAAIPDAVLAAPVADADMRVVRGIAYGPDARQRLDLYAPRVARDASVIVMVHGGGWRRGDKALPGVVEDKVARWVPQGAIVVSVNYRMLPEADPQGQARDVARAVATAQHQVARYGGSPDRFVLMGHSAGGHLVALLAASPELKRAAGVRPWLGTVLLDSGAIDTVGLMRAPHAPLYDDAFGTDPHYWAAASPLHQLRQRTAPVLAVCSSSRLRSCQAHAAFVDRARALGGRAQLLPQPLGHRAINVTLGEPNAYTRAVEDFLRSVGVRLAVG